MSHPLKLLNLTDTAGAEREHCRAHCRHCHHRKPWGASFPPTGSVFQSLRSKDICRTLRVAPIPKKSSGAQYPAREGETPATCSQHERALCTVTKNQAVCSPPQSSRLRLAARINGHVQTIDTTPHPFNRGTQQGGILVTRVAIYCKWK